MENVRVIEVTKENERLYLNQIASLEILVLNQMEKEGKIGQLFTTGIEDIRKYIRSQENTVMCAIDNENNVLSAVYITQGQKLFTYNDITKYFKSQESYQEYIKKTKFINNESQYLTILGNTYIVKIKAFQYAKEKLLQENTKYHSILEWLYDELNMEENYFHEKSYLREKINEYMVDFIQEKYPIYLPYYEYFYHISKDSIPFLQEAFLKEQYITKKDIYEYEEIIKKLNYTIYEEPIFDITKYYEANPNNSIEIDTYITNPNNRANGLSRIAVYEGIKKHMNNFFNTTDKNNIYLCSTLHRDNLSSKYVSEFFGLTDSLYVNRRYGRDREVHIASIDRKNYKAYLEKMAKKLAVIYGYNPNNLQITSNEIKKIYTEEKEYALIELERLKNNHSEVANKSKTYWKRKLESRK